MKAKITIAVLALGATLAVGSNAFAKSGDQTVNGTCSASSTSKLKVGQRDGKLKIEFEVDSNVKGQSWGVTLSDNGSMFLQKTMKTAGRSASFEARAKTANQAGTDAIQATATNGATGETCNASFGF